MVVSDVENNAKTAGTDNRCASCDNTTADTSTRSQIVLCHDVISDNELLSVYYSKYSSGIPMTVRKQTIAYANALMGVVQNETPTTTNTTTLEVSNTSVNQSNSWKQQQQQRPPLLNVYGQGPFFVSDIPKSCFQQNEKIVVGIDEAGRGSVVGPMVYGAAFWTVSDYESIICKAGCWTDSKKLTEMKRFDLMDNAILETPEIGFAFRVLHASEISRNMTRPVPYNLNQMSHDAAIGILHKLIDAGLQNNIDTCYIDTVGVAEHYQRKLENEFQKYHFKFVVESKADDKYAPCAAASIVAKVVRDRMLENWKYSESINPSYVTKNYGSGYPSDPCCKQWMQDSIDPVFGYPDIVRFSWGTTKALLEKNITKNTTNNTNTTSNSVVEVVFAADVDCTNDDDEKNIHDMNVLKRQRDQMEQFVLKKETTTNVLINSKKCPNNKKHKRQPSMPFFQRRQLQIVDIL